MLDYSHESLVFLTRSCEQARILTLSRSGAEIIQINKSLVHFCSISIGLFLLASSEAYAADVDAGGVTATQCAICHGVYGEGNGIPGSNIAIPDTDTFKQKIRDFKTGARKNVMMERFVKNLSDQDIENLAAYYAAYCKAK